MPGSPITINFPESEKKWKLNFINIPDYSSLALQKVGWDLENLETMEENDKEA